MRVNKVAAVQAHYVPARPHLPRGPFPPELFRQPEIVYDYEPEADGGGPVVPEGATAQNNYRAPKWFQCRICLETLREDELDAHVCETL